VLGAVIADLYPALNPAFCLREMKQDITPYTRHTRPTMFSCLYAGSAFTYNKYSVLSAKAHKSLWCCLCTRILPNAYTTKSHVSPKENGICPSARTFYYISLCVFIFVKRKTTKFHRKLSTCLPENIKIECAVPILVHLYTLNPTPPSVTFYSAD